MKKRALITLATCLLLSTSALAQNTGSGATGGGYGPGMMGGSGGGNYGPGASGGGYGPGMMGGYGGGYGPGMMGGYGGGYGPGMMGGYGGGYGPGMMGGYGGGYGPGMMGGYGYGRGPYIPDLTNEQQGKIAGIEREFHQKQWNLMGQMQEAFASGSFYRGGKIDEQEALKAFDAQEKLRREMFKNSLEAQKQINAVLTPKQREQLQREWDGR